MNRPVQHRFTDGVAPDQKHSPESKDAAKQIDPHLSRLQERVLRAIECYQPDGITDKGLVAHTGLEGSTLRPRRIELLEKGLIRQNGTRRQANGRSAAVWVTTIPS